MVNRLDGYINRLKSEGVTSHTLRKKQRFIGMFLEWWGKDPKDAKIDDLYTFFNECCVYSEEVNHRIKTALKTFYKYLNETGQSSLPYSLIKLQYVISKPIPHITKQEFDAMDRVVHGLYKSITNSRSHALLHILWETGLRRSEILHIGLNDIDFVNKVITVRCAKTKKFTRRRYYFDLSEYLETSKPKKFLFECGYNTPDIMVRRIAKQAGINRTLSCHSFRAGFITYLSQKGIPAQDIANYIGHADVETTMHYIRNSSEYLLNKVDSCFVPEKNVKTELKWGKRKIRIGLDIIG